VKYFKDPVSKNNINFYNKKFYTFTSIEVKNKIKFRIKYTVSQGVADSRIVTYEIENIGEEN
jgi:hypothetical protein